MPCGGDQVDYIRCMHWRCGSLGKRVISQSETSEIRKTWTSQDGPRSGDDYASVALLDAATALLSKRRPDIPGRLSCQSVWPCSAGGYRALRRAGSSPAFAEQSWTFLAERTAGAPKTALRAGRRMRRHFACLRSSMTICRFWSIPSSANSTSAASIFACSSIRCLPSSAIPPASWSTSKAPRTVGGPRESLIHLHVEGAAECGTAARSSRARSHPRRCARLRRRTGSPCWRGFASVIAELRTNPPPLPVDEIAEAIQFLEWIADENFTLLGARDLCFTDNEDVA